jgi:very-short-patch-repair endonuclease
MRGTNDKANKRKRQLRSQATDAETKLWFALRNRRLGGHKFARQASIGFYIADFVCREQKLVVEVDGGQHAENPKDRVRDTFMQSEGYRVLRFWNTDVLTNCDGVLTSILQALTKDKL